MPSPMRANFRTDDQLAASRFIFSLNSSGVNDFFISLDCSTMSMLESTSQSSKCSELNALTKNQSTGGMMHRYDPNEPTTTTDPGDESEETETAE